MDWTVLNQYSIFAAAFLAVIVVILLIVTLKVNARLKTIERRYSTLTRGLDGADWHDLMIQLGDDMADLKQITAEHAKFLQALDSRTQVQFCHRAMIHYDAFEHIHGQLSFSLCLLDENYDGFIFSNIHGREDARCYLKEVSAGKCAQFLSTEEQTVLAQAKGGAR